RHPFGDRRGRGHRTCGPRAHGACGPVDQRLRLASGRGDPLGRRGAPRRECARRARPRTRGQDPRCGEWAALRRARRHQVARRARAGPPSRARPGGGVRGSHPVERHRPTAARDPAPERSAGRVNSAGRSTRGGLGSAASTDTAGLATTRARIVGARTGVLADGIVAVVRAARTIWRAFRALAGRLGSVVTPLGWVVIAAIPVALASGYVLGWLELVAIGWGALVLALVAVLFLLGRAPYRMTLALPHRRAVVGESARASLAVENTGGHRLLGAVLEVPVGGSIVELALPGLRRG